MKPLTAILTCFLFFTARSQQVFFKSENFPRVQYASVTIKDGLVVYNAPDYSIYAYENGKLKWKKYTGWSSDVPPFFLSSGLWVSGNDSSMILDPATGETKKTLPFARLDTEPVEKNGVYYGTAIYDGGRVYAYDLKQDSVLWSKFIAHGTMTRPYFYDNHIYVNAESNYWIRLKYDGSFIEKKCEGEEYRFPSELSCAEVFNYITHDNGKITGRLAEDIFSSSEAKILTAKNKTFILDQNNLTIIGNKLKKEKTIDLSDLGNSFYNYGERNSILKADNENVWLLFSQHLLVYNYKKHVLGQIINLEQWEPHSALFNDDELWIVSKSGTLYGLRL